MTANKSQAGIAHQRAGKQAGLAENLKAVADAEDDTAGICELLDRFHHGREARDSASAEIISIGKTAGKDECVGIGEILRLVPDEFDRLLEYVAESVEGVVIAIRAGKDDHSKFHRVGSPSRIGKLHFNISPMRFLAAAACAAASPSASLRNHKRCSSVSGTSAPRPSATLLTASARVMPDLTSKAEAISPARPIPCRQ